MLPLMLLGSGIAFAAPGVVLVGPGGPVEQGQVAAFTLKVDGAPVVIDGCRVVEIERREGASWVVAPGAELCRGVELGRRIETSVTLSVSPPDPGEYRAVVGWGRGCVAGRPFALAACKELGFARSESFTVNGQR